MGPLSEIARVLLGVAMLGLLTERVPAQQHSTKPTGTLHALILTGRNNADWRATTPFLEKALIDSGHFDVRVDEEPGGLTASTFAGYDVLVLNYNGPRWGQTTETAVEEFVRSGKGLVIVHGASYPFVGNEILGERSVRTGIKEAPWHTYPDMIGGYWSEEPPKSGHGDIHTFTVRFIDRRHPISTGMPETFLATDEIYHGMHMRSDANVLATAFSDAKQRGSGKSEPILWTVNYGLGRVFHTTLGHDLIAMNEPGFVVTFLRGTEWSATGGVTLPTIWSPNRKARSAVRVLVVTGEYPPETSFYKLFEGYDDLTWIHATSSSSTLESDLRGQFDVLVLYDSCGQLSEARRKHLQGFIENGKGLVALHQAITGCEDWPWWNEKVVGGKLLRPFAGSQVSTLGEDQELFVQRVLRHPVTSDMGALHIWDEPYSSLWISPRAKVLLKTDTPMKDSPLAWIGPHDKARVVYIQPGHTRSTHLNPGYRLLVRNAILWTARRTN